MRTPIKRICKEQDINACNSDAALIVERAWHFLLNEAITHTQKMMEKDKHRLTSKTANLAFIGLLDGRGASTEICQEALERGRIAKESLFEA